MLHEHAAVHVKEAPKVDENTDGEVVAFIDRYATCHIPDKNLDPELHNLVMTRQSFYCADFTTQYRRSHSAVLIQNGRTVKFL